MLFKEIGILDENFDYKENMYVGVEKGKIDYIGPKRPPHDYGEEYNGKGRLLMPGFFNAHAHSPMALMRGYAENMKLQDWLFKRVFPFEAKLTGNAVYWGTLLCMAESMRFGIVSTSDMYYFMPDMSKAVLDSGCKANISRAIVSIDGSEDFDSYPSVDELKVAAKVFNGADNGRIKIDASLHAEYTSNQTIASKLADLTKELGLNMQVHVAETKQEAEECGENIIYYMDHRRSALIRLGSDAAHQICCKAVSDVDTDDNGKYCAEGNTDRTGNRLYNTDYSR